MKTLDYAEALARFDEVLDSVADDREEVVIARAGHTPVVMVALDDYEALALALANDPKRCAALRDKLVEVRESGVLFDTPLFVRDLEVRLQDLVAGLAAPQQVAQGV